MNRGKIAWREMCPPFHATGVKFHAAGGKWRETSRHWREIIKISRQSKFFFKFFTLFLGKRRQCTVHHQNLNFFEL